VIVALYPLTIRHRRQFAKDSVSHFFWKFQVDSLLPTDVLHCGYAATTSFDIIFSNQRRNVRMTEVSFERKSFLGMLDALRTQFELSSPTVVLETEPSGERFSLSARREDNAEVKAFGPCVVKGEPVRVEFDIADLQQAVLDAHDGIESDNVTLLVGDGIWVKDPSTAQDEA
jgi:hypothetical protein